MFYNLAKLLFFWSLQIFLISSLSILIIFQINIFWAICKPCKQCRFLWASSFKQFNQFVRFKKKNVFFLKGLYMKCDIDMTALADQKHCFEEMCYNFYWHFGFCSYFHYFFVILFCFLLQARYHFYKRFADSQNSNHL